MSKADSVHSEAFRQPTSMAEGLLSTHNTQLHILRWYNALMSWALNEAASMQREDVVLPNLALYCIAYSAVLLT